MTPFTFERATNVSEAIGLVSRGDGGRFLGGGTNLVDLMREGVEQASALIDVTGLSATIEETPQGGLLIGAATRNAALAAHPLVRERFPMLSRALLTGASGQIRNMATVGGNILQRTRCAYFYDTAARCNKRAPGSGCDALEGFNRMHAIVGTSQSCIAAHPSDMCVAMAALDAIVHTQGPAGKRSLPLATFHRLPGERPDIETELLPGELIVAVEVPPLRWAVRSIYRKVRDRASYAFALVSVAAALDLADDGTVRDLRVAFGGIAPRPWRAFEVEAALRGNEPTPDAIGEACAAELADARPLSGNGFKMELARRALGACILELAGDRI